MASVTFYRLYMNLYSDLTISRSFALNKLVRAPKVTVSSRANALGEFQMIRTPGRQRTTQVELNFCTDDDQAWLDAYQGELIVLRDPRGEKFYGYYDDSTFEPRFITNSWITPLTVTEITLDDIQ